MCLVNYQGSNALPEFLITVEASEVGTHKLLGAHDKVSKLAFTVPFENVSEDVLVLRSGLF